MYRQLAGPIWVAASLLLTMSAPVGAQEAIPETPPELRDFRLDQPRPSTGPQTEPVAQPTTQPAPSATPPPAVRTLPEAEVQPRTATSPASTRRDQAQAPAAALPSSSTGVLPADTAAPVEDEPPASAGEPQPAPDLAPASGLPPAQSAWDMSLILGLLGGALALALAGWLFVRRRRSPDGPEAQLAASHAEPLEPVKSEPKPEPSFKPISPPAKPLAKTPPPTAQPVGDVKILFIPEKATISFTTLTVRGQLQIANEGTSAAQDMELRAIILSASETQQQAMASFFADPTQVAPNALGQAKPGERLGLSLELSVSLGEMQSFPMGDWRLLVPILVANLSYQGADGQKKEARLACMIGREAKPPRAKMGPLRLDLGPRSFSPLGQRPVAA